MSRRLIVIVVTLSALAQMGSSAIAQTASPVAAGCQMSPMAPEPAFPATSNAPAAASPAASPVSAPTNAVEPEVAAQIELAARSLGACLTDGNHEGVADIATADFLGDAFGGGQRLSRNDYLTLATTAPTIPIRIMTIGQPVYSGMRTVAAEVELIAGNQLRLEQWTFVFRLSNDSDPSKPAASPTAVQGQWMVHRATPLLTQSPDSATRVEATLNEYTISLADNALSGPNIVLEGRNSGAEAHEMLVLRLTGGAIESLLRPSPESFPSGIAVIGQITLLPGAQQDLVLVEMPAGEYIIVCLFPDTSGVPHLAFGQLVVFTVR